MENLSKQQLILVALLISFVTSLATGIFTVSLMSQAPQGVVQTINQVVERTIEKVVSNDAAVGQSGSVGSVATASASVLGSVVKIRAIGTEKFTSLGLVVTSRGVILADKAALLPTAYEAVLPNGSVTPVSIIQSQLNGNVVFLAPSQYNQSPKIIFTPIRIASSTALGQEAFSISLATSTAPILGQGLVTSISRDIYSEDPIQTTLPSSTLMSGSPAFNSKGEIIGIYMSSLTASSEASFYSVGALRKVIPTL